MTRRRLIRRALILSFLSVGISALIGTSAVALSIAIGSLSLLGFGADAVIDAVASCILIWRFRIEVLHPHRADRVEQLAEALIGAVLITLAGYLAISAVSALIANAHPEPSVARIVLLVISIVVLPPLAVAKYRTAEALASPALRADSILTAVAAALAGIGLVAPALGDLLQVTWGDAAGALVVAVIVARAGWSALWAASPNCSAK